MAKHFFYKEIFTNKYICNGKAVAFEPLDGNSGVGVFEDGKDDEVLACLNHAASKHMGGIVPISEAEYTEKKSLRPFDPSAERLKQERLRVMPHRPFGPKEPGVVAPEIAAAIKSAPPMVASPVGETQLAVNPEVEAAKAKFQAVAQAQAVPQAPPPLPASEVVKPFKPATKRVPKPQVP